MNFSGYGLVHYDPHFAPYILPPTVPFYTLPDGTVVPATDSGLDPAAELSPAGPTSYAGQASFAGQTPYAAQAPYNGQRFLSDPSPSTSEGTQSTGQRPVTAPSVQRAVPKIRRPPNAFMVFANEHRKILAKAFPTENNQSISVRLGSMWKAMAQDHKSVYYAVAREAAAEHKRLYPSYVYSPKEARMRKQARELVRREKSVKPDTDSPSADPGGVIGCEGDSPSTETRAKLMEVAQLLDSISSDRLVQQSRRRPPFPSSGGGSLSAETAAADSLAGAVHTALGTASPAGMKVEGPLPPDGRSHISPAAQGSWSLALHDGGVRGLLYHTVSSSHGRDVHWTVLPHSGAVLPQSQSSGLTSGSPVLPQSQTSGGSVLPQSPVSGSPVLPQSQVSSGSVLPQNQTSSGSFLPQSQLSRGHVLPQSQTSGGAAPPHPSQVSHGSGAGGPARGVSTQYLPYGPASHGQAVYHAAPSSVPASLAGPAGQYGQNSPLEGAAGYPERPQRGEQPSSAQHCTTGPVAPTVSSRAGVVHHQLHTGNLMRHATLETRCQPTLVSLAPATWPPHGRSTAVSAAASSASAPPRVRTAHTSLGQPRPHEFCLHFLGGGSCSHCRPTPCCGTPPAACQIVSELVLSDDVPSVCQCYSPSILSYMDNVSQQQMEVPPLGQAATAPAYHTPTQCAAASPRGPVSQPLPPPMERYRRQQPIQLRIPDPRSTQTLRGPPDIRSCWRVEAVTSLAGTPPESQRLAGPGGSLLWDSPPAAAYLRSAHSPNIEELIGASADPLGL